MNIFLAVLIIIVLMPIGLYLYAKFTAVEGYEDENGFHRVEK